MVFIHDTRRTLEAVADLVNTLPELSPSGEDELADLAAFAGFLERQPYTRPRRDLPELEAVRAIRPRLRSLWGVDREAAVPIVNEMLRDGRALPQLVIHEGYDWHIHATDDDEPLDVRMLVEAAMAFVDVIRSDLYARVRICSADDCAAVYVDYSRNGSKRYCDTGNCGNRMHVNAYRRRQAAGSD